MIDASSVAARVYMLVEATIRMSTAGYVAKKTSVAFALHENASHVSTDAQVSRFE